jgi:tetratricopeptide (TPR) repeat protein
MQQGRISEAMELFQKALRLDPYSAPLNYEAGRLYDQMGRFDDALASYLRIIETEPDHAFAYVYIAAIHYLVYGRADESLIWYHKAAANDALSPSLHAAQALPYLELGDMESAKVWIERGLELGPETFWAVWASLLYNVLAGNEDQIQKDARIMLDINQGVSGALMFLRDGDMAAGRYEVARSRYARIFPALAAPRDPQIDPNNCEVAVDFALILQLLGEHDHAARLLDACLDAIATLPRLGTHGYYVTDVKILALQGRPDEALAALRSAVDEGWRFLTWYAFDMDPALESIRGRSEFQRLRDEVAKDLAMQAKRVKDLQASGELSTDS